jgi:hypothetical protein
MLPHRTRRLARAGRPGDIPYVLLGFALCASLRGDSELAATLHGAARALHDRNQGSYQALEAEMFDQDRARLIERLGKELFDDAYQSGADLDDAAAIALALRPD